MIKINAKKINSLPREDWDKWTNHGTLELPKAKYSTVPYIYEGGEPPVPHGTKISIWWPGRRDRKMYGHWAAQTSKEDTWDKPCVFRLRDTHEYSETVNQPDAMARIAMALERLADHICGPLP